MKNNNLTTNRQYGFYAQTYGEHKDRAYAGNCFILNVNRLYPVSDGEACEASIIVDRYDFVDIAKVVMKLVPVSICHSKKVTRRYFDGVQYIKDSTTAFAWEHCNTFCATAEKKSDHIVPDGEAKLYKLTLRYWNAFNRKEELEFVFRESDFIALGELACKVLDDEKFKGFCAN